MTAFTQSSIRCRVSSSPASHVDRLCARSSSWLGEYERAWRNSPRSQGSNHGLASGILRQKPHPGRAVLERSGAPERRDPRDGLVADIPDRAEDTAWAQHAGDLGVGSPPVEPVVRLSRNDFIDAAVRQRYVLGRAGHGRDVG